MIDFEEEGRAMLASADDQQGEADTPALPDVVRLAAQKVIASQPAVDGGEEPFTYAFSAEHLRSEIVFAMPRGYHATASVWMQQAPVGFAGGDPNLYRYVG